MCVEEHGTLVIKAHDFTKKKYSQRENSNPK